MGMYTTITNLLCKLEQDVDVCVSLLVEFDKLCCAIIYLALVNVYYMYAFTIMQMCVITS